MQFMNKKIMRRVEFNTALLIELRSHGFSIEHVETIFETIDKELQLEYRDGIEAVIEVFTRAAIEKGLNATMTLDKIIKLCRMLLDLEKKTHEEKEG